MATRDGLMSLAELLEADVRNTYFVRVDSETGEQRPNTLADHYAEIERYSLHHDVPDDIATQFDTARNLYVYAWFVYRFFNVAEAQVLTVLELALKHRIGDQEVKQYIKERNDAYRYETGKKGSVRLGMKTLMEYCRDHQLVRNEGFTQWHRCASLKAYRQAEEKRLEWAGAEMERTGAIEIVLPEIKVEGLPPDANYDHLQHLIDHTNKLRNGYAHGSTMLHSSVLEMFEMVSEFINQLYSSDPTTVDNK